MVLEEVKTRIVNNSIVKNSNTVYLQKIQIEIKFVNIASINYRNDTSLHIGNLNNEN